ncbi:MAG: hypothetical protein GY810_23150 [Aureispira sp.]|nr:hypothetical protein [Aureispira sp.]
MDLPQNSIPQLKRTALLLKIAGSITFLGIAFMELCWIAYSWLRITISWDSFYRIDFFPITIIMLSLIAFQIVGIQLWLSGQNFSKYLQSSDAQELNKGFKHLRWFWFLFGLVSLILVVAIMTIFLLVKLRIIR